MTTVLDKIFTTAAVIAIALVLLLIPATLGAALYLRVADCSIAALIDKEAGDD